MTIDFHTHIFPSGVAVNAIRQLRKQTGLVTYTEGTVSSLLESMRQAGVDLSVVLPVATHPQQVTAINEAAARLNETYAGTLFSFGAVHPETENVREVLQQVKALGLKGIKLHPRYQETFFDDIRYVRILDYAAQLGLIVNVHTGTDASMPEPVFCTPRHIWEVLKQVLPDKLVLAHMGAWRMWDEAEPLLAGLPVYLDLSVSLGVMRWDPAFRPGRADLRFLSPERFAGFVRKHGAERVLFGSDSPWGGQKETLEELDKVPLPPKEKELIRGINAEKLLDL